MPLTHIFSYRHLQFEAPWVHVRHVRAIPAPLKREKVVEILIHVKARCVSIPSTAHGS